MNNFFVNYGCLVVKPMVMNIIKVMPSRFTLLFNSYYAIAISAILSAKSYCNKSDQQLLLSC